MLKFKRMPKSEKEYALNLARREINMEAKRLDQYKTYLLYQSQKKIGFTSFNYRPQDKTIYIYILAFEQHAQRQGYAAQVLSKIMHYGCKKYPDFKGLTATVRKTNAAAINCLQKYGFQLIKERKNYLDFFHPVTEGKFI